MLVRLTTAILLVTTCFSNSRADDGRVHVHGSHEECPLPKRTLDVVKCAQELHPKIQRLKLSLSQSGALSEKTGQFKNPELDIESASGKSGGVDKTESKVSLLIPFELGGKRSARKIQAESETEMAQAELLEAQAQVISDTVMKLHRLRQLDREKTLLEAAVKNFSQVVNQQKQRPGLAPEQKVSLSVFRMALSEAKIRLSELFEEEKALEHYFHISTGHSLKELIPVLPVTPKKWPQVKNVSANQLSPGLLAAKAELKLAQAELQSAQAETWPDIKIGPMVQIEESGGNKDQIYGFQLSMDLPIFSLNGGGRTYAKLGVDRFEKSSQLTRNEETHERLEKLAVYERTVEVLKDSLSAEELEKDHKSHEGFAKRGLVSAALIIESHRQIEELTKSRHAREIKALEALWEIYKFDGHILTEEL